MAEKDTGSVFVGRKPVMNYVVACLTFFNSNETAVTVKARGRAISTAVDVVEVVRRRFFEGKMKVIDIAIGTQAMGEGGDVRNVSTIEIKVEKTE